MMGRSHAISGAMAWLATVPLLAPATEPASLAAGAVVCAGAALLPDLDHPNSTIAHSFGPLTQVVAGTTEVLSGGHRHATHSIAFAALSAASVWAALGTWHENAGLVVVAFFSGLAYRALDIVPSAGKLSGWLACLALSVATAAAFAHWMPSQWGVLPIAVLAGCLIHLVGDTLTGPIPWLWPLHARFCIPLIPSTGGVVETWLIAPAMLAVTAYLAWTHVADPVWHQLLT